MSVNAKKSDAIITIDTTTPTGENNRPAKPDKKISGTKIATVVTVEETTGPATSAAASTNEVSIGVSGFNAR